MTQFVDVGPLVYGSNVHDSHPGSYAPRIVHTSSRCRRRYRPTLYRGNFIPDGWTPIGITPPSGHNLVVEKRCDLEGRAGYGLEGRRFDSHQFVVAKCISRFDLDSMEFFPRDLGDLGGVVGEDLGRGPRDPKIIPGEAKGGAISTIFFNVLAPCSELHLPLVVSNSGSGGFGRD